MDESIIDETFLTYASEILGDTDYGLSDLEIKKYCSEYAAKLDISLPSSDKKYPNKRTRLFEYLKSIVNIRQCATLIYELTLFSKVQDNDKVKILRYKLVEKYGEYIDNKITDKEIIQKVKHWLEKYPKAYSKYNQAIILHDSRNFTRNILDNMRLSLELLLKEILKNEKSLENQDQELLKQLKEHNISQYIRNMFKSIIDMYCKYNNENIKHDDNVNIKEMDYMIDQTSIMMKFIIDILGTTQNKVSNQM